MTQALFNFFGSFPLWLTTIIVAALPISELRGAIPIAMAFGQPLIPTFLLAIFGNMLPVIPLLLFLDPVSAYLRKFPLWAKFFDWLFERTEKSAHDAIQKWAALGLCIFVAIPLPMTGAWSGCVAASLFKIKFRYALPSIFFGVVGAGVIVTALTLLGLKLV